MRGGLQLEWMPESSLSSGEGEVRREERASEIFETHSLIKHP